MIAGRVALTGKIPPEFAFRGDWPTEPVVCGAGVPSGWSLVVSQHGVVSGAARLERDAGDARSLRIAAVRVWTSGAQATPMFEAVSALPDGRALLAMPGSSFEREKQSNAYLDPGSLEMAPAGPDLTAALDPLHTPGSHDYSFAAVGAACRLGGCLLVGQRKEPEGIAASRLVELPSATKGLAGPARIWAPEMFTQARARGLSPYNWRIEGFAALSDAVLLVGQTVMRSGSSDHAFLTIGGDENLLAIRPNVREQVRAPDLRVLADQRRGLFVVCGGGRLELLDAQLVTAAQAREGHPFLKAHRLLAGDGNGGLLWYAPASGALVWSGPDELEPSDLNGGLDRLGESSPVVVRRPRGTKSPKPLVPPRPAIDASVFRDLADQLRPQMAALVAKPPTLPRELTGLRDGAESLVAWTAVTRPDDPFLLEALRWVSQAGAALFQVSVGLGGLSQIPVRIGDATTLVEATVPTLGNTSHLRWIWTWYAALVARDTASLDILAGCPDETFWSHPADDYFVLWRDALRATRAGDAGARALAERAIAACVPERFKHVNPKALVAIEAPYLPLLPALLSGDTVVFRETLVSALRAHAKYWSPPSRRNDQRGWVAWGPMALCRVAADQGFEIDVSSDYLLPV